MKSKKLYLLYLDRYRMEDQLFLQQLARTLSGKFGDVPSCLVLHGSGEYAERALEGEGLFPERRGGILQTDSPRAEALVERAIRRFNKKLVGLLTDEVVSAVGVQGINRNLFRLDEEGRLRAGGFGWVKDLAEQGVVPVLSALAYDREGRIREVWSAEAAVRAAKALPQREVEVIFFTKNDRPGLLTGDNVQEVVRVVDLPGDEVLPEPEAVQEVASAGLPVLLTDVKGFVEEGGPVGTRVRA